MTAQHMVDATGIATRRGDSGGPVYASSTAWGITGGRRTSNGNFVFSKIQNAEIGLGVTVAY